MKRSIFSPLMWLSLTIIFVSAIVMGSVHFVLIDRYVLNTKTAAMKESAEKASEITAVFAQSYSPVMEQLYVMNLDYIAENTQSYVVVTNLEGFVVNCSTKAKRIITQNEIDISAFEDIKNGQNVSKIGVFNDLFGVEVFTIAVPVVIGGKVYGAVFLNSPIPDIQREKATFFYMLAVSIGLSSLVAFILSSVISVAIVKPIKILSNAALDIAKGNFEKRVAEGNVKELAELATAFNTMAQSLQRHEDVRSAFIANVSHDLRTPMTTISGFVGGILDGTIPHEKQSDYLKIVLSETKRLSKLINSFLDISRYDEANAPLNKTSFDIVEMLRVVLLSFENTVNERSISIYFEYPQENIFVFADESEIYRVAVNLIDNAVKFVNDGGNIDVLVKLDHNKVFVSIANTGEGISDDDKAYIWDRFYKTDKSRTGEKGGFGLGLYIVRSIIKNHGEDIYLDNSGGKTSFTFTLPVVK